MVLLQGLGIKKPLMKQKVIMAHAVACTVSQTSRLQAAQYAYRDRRQRKREFRALWIVRVSAAARLHGMTYSAS